VLRATEEARAPEPLDERAAERPADPGQSRSMIVAFAMPPPSHIV
jgi:hypothetical protein